MKADGTEVFSKRNVLECGVIDVMGVHLRFAFRADVFFCSGNVSIYEIYASIACCSSDCCACVQNPSKKEGIVIVFNDGFFLFVLFVETQHLRR